MCNSHNDDNFVCSTCKHHFHPSDFDHIDDEFDSSNPQCVDCQSNSRIDGESCEFCDLPAEYETESLYLCSDHYDDYVDGYSFH